VGSELDRQFRNSMKTRKATIQPTFEGNLITESSYKQQFLNFGVLPKANIKA
jgi:hypothetical protein